MSPAKNNWSEPKWLSKLLGTGRRRYFLGGLLSIVGLNLLNGLLFLFELPRYVFPLLVAVVLIGALLSSAISLRLRYWRDIMLWRAVSGMTVVIGIFIATFTLLIEKEGVSTFVFIFTMVLISIYLAFLGARRDIAQLELARRKGYLKEYLDEKRWVYDDDPAKASECWFAIQRAENGEKARSLAKWLGRLEKLHYLIPGIAISFRRAFGHEELVLSVLLITLGLALVYGVLSSILSYFKIREWEKERGKPILLRWAWEKEHRKMFEKTG